MDREAIEGIIQSAATIANLVYAYTEQLKNKGFTEAVAQDMALQLTMKNMEIAALTNRNDYE